jgi:hypothetical protein
MANRPKQTLVLIFLCTLGIQVANGQSCSIGDKILPLPFVNGAFDDWASRNSVTLSQEAKSLVLRDYCDAASEFISANGAGYDQIASLAKTVTEEYLDGEVSESSAVRPIGAILRAKLGSAGLFRKGKRKLATITISFSEMPDKLFINDQEYLPNETGYMVAPGTASVRATAKSGLLCASKTAVKQGEKLQINCGK